MNPKEMAGRGGLMNFTRTLTGAFAVSVITTTSGRTAPATTAPNWPG